MRSFDASTHTDLPIPYDGIAALIDHLQRRREGVVVIGAVARDLLASAAGGLAITRATKDVDVAVAVATIGDYSDLGDLRPGRAPPSHDYHGLPVDVVPYGAVEDAKRHVLLPNDFLLDTTGIAEAARTAVSVTLPGGTTIPVASLEAQSVLKVLAWRDRGTYGRRKDAQDLGTILRAASAGVYAATLYDDPDLLERYDYDLEDVGCHRLGRDAAAILGSTARTATHDVVANPAQRDALVRAMDGLHDGNKARLHAWLTGFQENGRC